MQQKQDDLGENIQIVAVNVTKFEKSKQNVYDLVEVLNLEFPVLLDEDAAVFTKYLLRGIPATFAIDSEGEIHAQQLGLIGPDFLETAKSLQ